MLTPAGRLHAEQLFTHILATSMQVRPNALHDADLRSLAEIAVRGALVFQDVAGQRPA